MKKYSKETEELMRIFYGRLSEKDKRSYAAVEAYKLGHGGQQYISEVLGCCNQVILRGLTELNEKVEYETIRLPGGGPKKIVDQNPEILDIFWEIILNHTAGDPMNEHIKWTDLSVMDIAEQFRARGYEVSKYVVTQILADGDFVKRKAKKEAELKKSPNRNEQFENIAALIEDFKRTGDPIISVDVKKKKKSEISIEKVSCTVERL